MPPHNRLRDRITILIDDDNMDMQGMETRGPETRSAVERWLREIPVAEQVPSAGPGKSSSRTASPSSSAAPSAAATPTTSRRLEMSSPTPGELLSRSSTPVGLGLARPLPIRSATRSAQLKRDLEEVRDENASKPPSSPSLGSSFVDLTEQAGSRRGSNSLDTIEVEDIDDPDDAVYFREQEEMRELPELTLDVLELDDTDEPVEVGKAAGDVKLAVPRRNTTPEPPFVEVESCRWYDHLIIPGKTVELHDGDFLRVTSILQNIQEDDVYRLRGWRFCRTKSLGGRLLKMRNEVCMILRLDLDDPRDPLVQGIEEVDRSEVVRLRSLMMTNRDVPALTFYENYPADMMLPDQFVYDNCRLVCRWKKFYYYPNAWHRLRRAKGGKEIQVAIIKVREDEVGLATPVPESARVSDAELRRQWRGETIKGEPCSPRVESTITFQVPRTPSSSGKRGDGIIIRPDTPCVDLTSSSESDTPTTPRHRHGLRPTEPLSPTVQAEIRRCRRRLLEVPIPAVIDLDTSENETDNDIIISTSVETKKRSQETGEVGGANMRTVVTSRTKRRWSSARDEVVASVEVAAGHRQHAEVTTVVSSGGTPVAKRVRSDFVQCLTPPDTVHTVRIAAGEPSTPQHTYTFADGFCGAGGMSCAAQLAGLRVKYGFDIDRHAIDSYALNHIHAECYLASVEQFLATADDTQVDILHLSPPCQVFSPAHTCPGKDDEKNLAVIFALQQLLAKVKPRVVTMEETFGLVSMHSQVFSSVLRIFTDHGFSVRYGVCDLQEYGCVQHRRRLVLYAACPGEVLPEFPKRTHSDNPAVCRLEGIARAVTVHDCISSIPLGTPNHNLQTVKQRQEIPYCAHGPLPRCITCSGGQNYHPSGKRDFTRREFACLQGFPLDYKFGKVKVLRQIGNAVPPSVGKVLLNQVKETLMRADGLLP
ncbi:MAG: hypothetical protein M1823_000308 [Watsoniomyces obsoletus]|nr:MAG: hypothetical protein M1823_000308 [Watsoniomyces obsoletus]